MKKVPRNSFGDRSLYDIDEEKNEDTTDCEQENILDCSTSRELQKEFNKLKDSGWTDAIAKLKGIKQDSTPAKDPCHENQISTQFIDIDTITPRKGSRSTFSTTDLKQQQSIPGCSTSREPQKDFNKPKDFEWTDCMAKLREPITPRKGSRSTFSTTDLKQQQSIPGCSTSREPQKDFNKPKDLERTDCMTKLREPITPSRGSFSTTDVKQQMIPGCSASNEFQKEFNKPKNSGWTDVVNKFRGIKEDVNTEEEYEHPILSQFIDIQNRTPIEHSRSTSSTLNVKQQQSIPHCSTSIELREEFNRLMELRESVGMHKLRATEEDSTSEQDPFCENQILGQLKDSETIMRKSTPSTFSCYVIDESTSTDGADSFEYQQLLEHQRSQSNALKYLASHLPQINPSDRQTYLEDFNSALQDVIRLQKLDSKKLTTEIEKTRNVLTMTTVKLQDTKTYWETRYLALVKQFNADADRIEDLNKQLIETKNALATAESELEETKNTQIDTDMEYNTVQEKWIEYKQSLTILEEFQRQLVLIGEINLKYHELLDRTQVEKVHGIELEMVNKALDDDVGAITQTTEKQQTELICLQTHIVEIQKELYEKSKKIYYNEKMLQKATAEQYEKIKATEAKYETSLKINIFLEEQSFYIQSKIDGMTYKN